MESENNIKILHFLPRWDNGGMEHAVIAHGPGEPGGAGGVRPGGGPAFRLPPPAL